MARVFISVLGTGDYVECIYTFDDGLASRQTRYVQEASVNRFCKDWGPNDRIIIFTTSEAETQNWFDHNYCDKDQNLSYEREGLKSRLESLKLSAQITNIGIKEGKSVDEIWSIFQVIFDSLGENDEITFDITHSFRSIPMLAMVVLNYAKVLKNIKLSGIYYGAFEVLGRPNEAKTILLSDRKAPIFNLTPFVELQDWSIAIDRFLKAGDATMAAELADNQADQIKRKFRRPDENTKFLKAISGTLKDFSSTMLTCRGANISKHSKGLKDIVSKCEAVDSMPALKPLIKNLREMLHVFKGDEVEDAIFAAQWCAEHNLVPQAYIILREFMISHVCKRNQVDPWDPFVRGDIENSIREETASWTKFKKNSTNRGGHRSAVQPTLDVLGDDVRLAGLFNELFQLRNDISHSGIRKQPKNADKLVGAVNGLIQDAKNIVMG